MKKATLFLLLFFTLSITAQNISITKSEIFKDSKRMSNLEFSLEDNDGGLITIRAYYGGLVKKLKGYYIQYFNSDLKLINETEYEVDKNSIRNAFVKDNKLHLIEFDHDKKADAVKFNVASANIKDLKFSKKELISFSEDNMQKFFGFSIFPFIIDNSSKFDGNHLGEVVLSSNNNYFVINFDIKNKNKETHKVFVFNNNFEKVYEQLIEKDIKDKFFEYNSIDVDDNDGTVYFLGKAFENKSRRSKKKGKANYHFELYKVDANGQQSTSFKYADKFISSLELLKDGDRIACVGFYGKKDVGRYNGVCLISLDPNSLNILLDKFTPFSDQFMTDKYGNREGKKERKKEKGVNSIDFKGLYIMENGDIVVNAEEFYITTHTSMSSNGGMRTYTVYHFNDIMSIKLDKDGNLIWARNINKAQTGLNNSSFTSIPVGDNIHFFINCSDRIKKLSADRISFKQTRSKKSNLYVITIKSDGNFDFKKLIDDKESKVYYKVNNGNVNLDKQTVILIGKRKKKTRILKLAI